MGSPQSRHSGQEGAEVQGARAALTETPTKRGHVRTPRACASAIVRTRARGHPEVLPTPHPSGCLMRFCVVPDIRPCPTRPGASQHPLTTHLASRANAWPMRHSRGWCQRGLDGVLRKARRPGDRMVGISSAHRNPRIPAQSSTCSTPSRLHQWSQRKGHPPPGWGAPKEVLEAARCCTRCRTPRRSAPLTCAFVYV